MTSERINRRPSLGLQTAIETVLRQRRDVMPVLGPQLELMAEAGTDSFRIGGTDDESIRNRLNSLRSWRGRLRERHPYNSALVDTTLVSAVHGLTLGEGRSLVTAGTLLDLATFARAAVLYDRLLVLPGAAGMAEELNAVLGVTVVHPLELHPTVDEAGRLTEVSAVLGNMFDAAMGELAQVVRAGRGSALHQDAKAIAEGWSALLGRRITSSQALNSDLDESHRWDSDGPGLIRRLTELEPAAGHGDPIIRTFGRFPRIFSTIYSEQDLRNFVSECNHRSYFNLRLAHALEVPYVPSVARLPFRSRLYRSAAFAGQRLMLHEEVDRRFYHMPDRLELPLPVHLVIALKRAAEPAALLSEIAELRERGNALRKRRMEYERALLAGDSPELIERLRAAITAEMTRYSVGFGDLTPVALGAAAALAAATSTTAALMISLIGILQSLGSTNADRAVALRNRLLRPVEWFLSSTTSTASAITTTSADIRRLWGLGEQDTDWLVKRLAAMGALGPS